MEKAAFIAAFFMPVYVSLIFPDDVPWRGSIAHTCPCGMELNRGKMLQCIKVNFSFNATLGRSRPKRGKNNRARSI